jgi:FAD/FMN-containing dehydrogenase
MQSGSAASRLHPAHARLGKIPAPLEQEGTMSTNTGASTTPAGQTQDAAAVLDALRDGRAGDVISESDERYDEARRVWNGSVDRRPLAVVRCANNSQVAATIAVARDRGVPLSVRGGGHSVVGFGSCDGGIVLDLSLLRDVTVDAASSRAWAGGGCTWADYDAATQEFGLASTGGLVSTTGVAGLTLGGGIGWLTRAHGLACDNLVRAELVTASGETVTASAEQNDDLFWAIRGGGSNFGVVTRFEFALHPVGEVTAAMLMWPLGELAAVGAAYREWVRGLGDEFATMLVILTGPDMTELPDEIRRRPCVAVVGCHIGSEIAADHDLAPLRALPRGTDLTDRVAYTDLQQMFDEDVPPGHRYYFSDVFFDELSDAVLDALAEAARRCPSPGFEIDLHHMGGVAGRVDPSATAFSNRAARFVMNAYACWEDPADDAAHRDWVRAVRAACAPHAASGGYVNFASEVGSPDDVRDSYGEARYERLVQVKRRWDPGNLFRLNQNIVP